MNCSERLAARSMKLLAKGVFPSPVESDVTVIVRSTRSDWTAACVEVLQTCTAEPVKLIVVPDQSYDPELAGKYRLNLALAEVKTDFFVLLDDGVIVTPHWLTRLLWTFHDDSAVGIAAPVSNLDSDSDFCSGIDELFAFARKIAEQNSGMWEPVHSFRGTCFAGRKSVLDEIGGLDYSLQSHEARLLDWCSGPDRKDTCWRYAKTRLCMCCNRPGRTFWKTRKKRRTAGSGSTANGTWKNRPIRMPPSGTRSILP